MKNIKVPIFWSPETLPIVKILVKRKKVDLKRNHFSELNPCPEGWFQCNSGSCIQFFMRCDGSDQCINEKDEQMCCKFNRFIENCLSSILWVVSPVSLLRSQG